MIPTLAGGAAVAAAVAVLAALLAAAVAARTLVRRRAAPPAAAPDDEPPRDAGPPRPTLPIEVATATDPGCVRTENEDSVRVVRTAGAPAGDCLVVVCDGMGGHAAGEIASSVAADVIATHWSGATRTGVGADGALAEAVRRAHDAVRTAAKADARRAGMGTTCVALAVRDGEARCAHVGDSRCYLVREEQIFLMTEDHSQVMELVRRGELAREEARTHPDRNVISQALGGKRAVQVSTWPAPLATRAGDRFLLCSDGLTDVVGDAELLAVVSALPPQGACERLVALARAAGAPDNVTVAILGVGSAAVPEPAPRETRPIKLAG